MFWKLKDGSYAGWERLLRDPDLQEQLVAKAAFHRTLAKLSGSGVTSELGTVGLIQRGTPP